MRGRLERPRWNFDLSLPSAGSAVGARPSEYVIGAARGTHGESHPDPTASMRLPSCGWLNPGETEPQKMRSQGLCTHLYAEARLWNERPGLSEKGLSERRSRSPGVQKAAHWAVRLETASRLVIGGGFHLPVRAADIGA